jgi:hypothetical protein
VVSSSVDRHACTCTARQDHPEHHAVSDAGAIDCFGCCEAIRVVLDAKRTIENSMEIFATPVDR